MLPDGEIITVRANTCRQLPKTCEPPDDNISIGGTKHFRCEEVFFQPCFQSVSSQTVRSSLWARIHFQCAEVSSQPFSQRKPHVICFQSNMKMTLASSRNCTPNAMDLAYMCVKPQMRLYVCQALPFPKHQMRLHVCHQMRFICVSPNAFVCVSPNAFICVSPNVSVDATELASLAYLCSLRSFLSEH